MKRALQEETDRSLVYLQYQEKLEGKIQLLETKLADAQQYQLYLAVAALIALLLSFSLGYIFIFAFKFTVFAFLKSSLVFAVVLAVLYYFFPWLFEALWMILKAVLFFLWKYPKLGAFIFVCFVILWYYTKKRLGKLLEFSLTSEKSGKFQRNFQLLYSNSLKEKEFVVDVVLGSDCSGVQDEKSDHDITHESGRDEQKASARANQLSLQSQLQKIKSMYVDFAGSNFIPSATLASNHKEKSPKSPTEKSLSMHVNVCHFSTSSLREEGSALCLPGVGQSYVVACVLHPLPLQQLNSHPGVVGTVVTTLTSQADVNSTSTGHGSGASANAALAGVVHSKQPKSPEPTTVTPGSALGSASAATPAKATTSPKIVKNSP